MGLFEEIKPILVLMPFVSASNFYSLLMMFTAWNLRSRSRSITQEELAKRPDPFCLPNLLDGLEDGLYGRLADDVKRLCKLRQEYLNGSISLEDIEARQDNKRAKSSHNLIIDSDDELPQESVTQINVCLLYGFIFCCQV